MAKSKIIWSNRAKKRLYGILEFYITRNKSKLYSNELYLLIHKEIKLLLKHSDLGLRTNEETIRGMIIGNCIVYYEKNKNKILIHTIWESIQNQDGSMIK